MPDDITPENPFTGVDARFATNDFIAHYDPNRVYVRASDDKGHATVLRVPLPHHVVGMLKTFVGDERTPHRSVNDAIRDAIYHWAYWWSEELRKSPGKPPVMHPALVQAAAERIRERDLFFRGALDSLTEWYRRGVQAADWDEFLARVQDLAGIVHTSQAKDYERFLEEIDRDRNR